jgi:hypothetical protein
MENKLKKIIIVLVLLALFTTSIFSTEFNQILSENIGNEIMVYMKNADHTFYINFDRNSAFVIESVFDKVLVLGTKKIGKTKVEKVYILIEEISSFQIFSPKK